MPLSRHTKADLVLILVSLLAAAGWVFSREALQGLPPMLFIGSRFLLAAMILLWVARRDWHVFRDHHQLGRMLATGCLMAAALVLWVHGLAYGGHMGEGAFLTVLAVVLVPFATWLLFREQVAVATWRALPVATIGLACLALPNGFSFNPGQWYFISAAILFAFHFSILGRLANQVPSMLLSATQLMMVGTVSLVASYWLEIWPTSVAPHIWWWFLSSAVIATSLRFALQTYGQSLAPSSHVALILVLEPVWTAMCGAVIYGETMLPLQLAGCGLIFTAIIIGRWHWVRAVLRKV